MLQMRSFRKMLGVGMVAALALVISGTVHAEKADVTTELQAAVAKLSPEQQTALLVLISGMSTPAAKSDAAPAKTAKEALFESLKAFETAGAGKEFNLEPFLANISEDFKHPVVQDKAGVRRWLDAMSAGLFDEGKPLIEFDLSDVEVTEDGKEAQAYPIDIDTPLGSATVEIEAKLEKDGVWRVVAIDGL